MKKLLLMITAMVTMLTMFALPISAEGNEEKSGKITTSKESSWIDPDELIAQIELEIHAENDIVKVGDEASIGIALVIDVSNSMDDPIIKGGKKKLDILKESAKNLIEQLFDVQGIELEIALVPFGGSVASGTNYQKMLDDKTGLLNGISSLTTSGSTNLNEAILNATSLLDGSTNDYKYMIVLSDGQPTYHVAGSDYVDVDKLLLLQQVIKWMMHTI